VGPKRPCFRYPLAPPCSGCATVSHCASLTRLSLTVSTSRRPPTHTQVQLWDTVKCRRVRTMGGHRMRVGTLAWCAHRSVVSR
jgi:hypothetical protein